MGEAFYFRFLYKYWQYTVLSFGSKI